MSHNKHYVMQP